MNEKQKENLEQKQAAYFSKEKPEKKYTISEIALFVINNEPDRWFFTWELMGSTKWGWLSHATHATLRVLQQQGKIMKARVGKYVVYSSIQDQV